MAKKKLKENKALLERGKKSRAGMLLSSYLRAIAQEKTETLIVNGPNGKPLPPRLVSKAEMLARSIWAQALDIDPLTDGRLRLEYSKLVLDRIDGKAGADVDDAERKRLSPADRMSEMNKERMNRIAKEAEEKG